MTSEGTGSGPAGDGPFEQDGPPSGASQTPRERQEQPPPPPNAMQPAPPVPPARSAYDGGPVGAGLGPRVGARLLDVLIVAIPLSIVLSLVGWGAGAALDVGGGQGRITALIQSLLWFGYFVWLESSQGATLGKRIVGIEVQGPDGGPPSVERAMKRNAWVLVGVIPVVGGVLWLAAVIAIMITINSGSNMQGLHDEWATTAVLRRR